MERPVNDAEFLAVANRELSTIGTWLYCSQMAGREPASVTKLWRLQEAWRRLLIADAAELLAARADMPGGFASR